MLRARALRITRSSRCMSSPPTPIKASSIGYGANWWICGCIYQRTTCSGSLLLHPRNCPPSTPQRLQPGESCSPSKHTDEKSYVPPGKQDADTTPANREPKVRTMCPAERRATYCQRDPSPSSSLKHNGESSKRSPGLTLIAQATTSEPSADVQADHSVDYWYQLLMAKDFLDLDIRGHKSPPGLDVSSENQHHPPRILQHAPPFRVCWPGYSNHKL
ncbi:hypothetical protein PMIN02_002093 [Paraphaeosphaeria minitans]